MIVKNFWWFVKELRYIEKMVYSWYFYWLLNDDYYICLYFVVKVFNLVIYLLKKEIL